MRQQKLRSLGGFALLAMALACGGGSSASGTGGLIVRVVDGPINGYSEINVLIDKVEVHSAAGGWITLGEPHLRVNLLALTGGASATLANSTLSEGHYTQMRLVLGSGNTLKLADGTTADLTTPSGMQSGLKLLANFDVQAGTTKDIVIDFDAAHSIQVTRTGASNKYILRPTLRAVDVMATGSVSGTFTDAAGAPLAGAEVTAQVLDGGGQALVVRRVYTSASGAYRLDLLPVGATYYVVSQPVSAGLAYQAQASGAFALSAGTPTFTYNTSFTGAVATGSVNGTLTPTATADQHDVVELAQTLATGSSGSASLIVRSTVASVGATETYDISLVPVGAYVARSTRYTAAADGSVTASATPATPLTVSAGLSAVVNFSF